MKTKYWIVMIISIFVLLILYENYQRHHDETHPRHYKKYINTMKSGFLRGCLISVMGGGEFELLDMFMNSFAFSIINPLIYHLT